MTNMFKKMKEEPDILSDMLNKMQINKIYSVYYKQLDSIVMTG